MITFNYVIFVRQSVIGVDVSVVSCSVFMSEIHRLSGWIV